MGTNTWRLGYRWAGVLVLSTTLAGLVLFVPFREIPRVCVPGVICEGPTIKKNLLGMQFFSMPAYEPAIAGALAGMVIGLMLFFLLRRLVRGPSHGAGADLPTT